MLKNKQNKYSNVFLEMVEFIRELGVDVHINTNARGHQGFFLRDRIDISKNLSDERKIEVLIHEFTHYIHYKLDPSVVKKDVSLATIFPNSDLDIIENELYNVTMFIEQNKAISKLLTQKTEIKARIKAYENELKTKYKDFKKSYPYNAFEKQIKKSDAKYLLKYDRVQIKTFFLGKTNLYTVKNIDNDFPNLKQELKIYIKLKSDQRLLNRVSSRIRKLNKYYKKPTELFARFIEALFIDTKAVVDIAPYTYGHFCKELSNNKYLDLANFINKFF